MDDQAQLRGVAQGAVHHPDPLDPEGLRKILTVSSQVHKDLVEPIVQREDHQRVWEAQREAAQRQSQAPAPVVEFGHKL